MRDAFNAQGQLREAQVKVSELSELIQALADFDRGLKSALGLEVLTTEEESEILYQLTSEDANHVARELGVQRPLTEDELGSIRKGVEWGLGEVWHDVMREAVRALRPEPADDGHSPKSTVSPEPD